MDQITTAALLQDTRFAFRIMRRNPGFTVVAIVSLALGMGANTAIFSLINTLMLRTLPLKDPHQLVELLQKYPGEPRGSYWSQPSFDHIRRYNHVFSDVIATSGPARVTVRGEGVEPQAVNGELVSGDFFPVLGVHAAVGRLITPADREVAVISWSYWRNRFNLDPAILGKRLIVKDMPVTIIGVAQSGFSGLQPALRTDIWLPDLGHSGSVLLARLKPGATLEQARAEMAVLYQLTIEERASKSEDPLVRQLRAEVEPAANGLSFLRDRLSQPLMILMAVAGLLLLITCTSLASLLVARGAARQKEMAVRVSLGAGRARLMVQVLTESVILSSLGGALGVILAYLGARGLVRMLASGRPMIGLQGPLDIPFEPDLHILLFTASAALLTGILFGLSPAWHAFAGTLVVRGPRRLLGKSLVIAQVALSVVLLSATGLFGRHLAGLESADLGFRRDHVLLVSLDPSSSGYTPERLSAAYLELLGRLEQVPGVRSASLIAPTPLSGAGAARFAKVEGFQEERPQDRRYLSLSWVAPKCLETLGIPLLSGRDFRLRDQNVAIINQAMARYYFAQINPLGKHVTLDGNDKVYQIVGVAGDAHYYEIHEKAPRTIYLPAFEGGRVEAHHLVLRTNVNPSNVSGDVRRVVQDVLKTVPVSKVITLSDQIDASIVPERIIATLSGVFGMLGGLLAAIGLYGLLAYTVARRIPEFGIRFALGATPGNVIRMVLKDAVAMVCAGLLIGAPFAFWAQTVVTSLLPGLPVGNLVPVLFGIAAMMAFALLAALLPARRAAGVDPMVALRHD